MYFTDNSKGIRKKGKGVRRGDVVWPGRTSEAPMIFITIDENEEL